MYGSRLELGDKPWNIYTSILRTETVPLTKNNNLIYFIINLRDLYKIVYIHKGVLKPNVLSLLLILMEIIILVLSVQVSEV